MSNPRLQIGFYGATGTVTGSKYLVSHQSSQILVDCGLFQGYKQLRRRNWAPPPFSARDVDAIVLTHAHLDHSGAVPLIIRHGFQGPVYCTPATAELCAILWPDSGRLHEADARYANRKGFSKHSPALPLYTEREAKHALDRLRPVEFGEWFEPAKHIKVSYHGAGHILGAASVLVQAQKRSVFFSGDVGRPDDVIMLPPALPPAADVFVVESTYGNRAHPPGDAAQLLAEAVAPTLERGGVVVIPAFAVGRTQALLLLLLQLFEAGTLPRVPVYLDSPMAIATNGAYKREPTTHRLSEAEMRKLDRFATYVREAEESKALDARDGPMIIVSASGMATGGRVVHHLKRFAPDPNNLILFAGYQAGGTRGGKMVGGAASVRIHGEDVRIRARVATLDVLSAHADADEILAWLRSAPKPPGMVYLTHGEPDASEALRERIAHELRWPCDVPEFRDTVGVD